MKFPKSQEHSPPSQVGRSFLVDNEAPPARSWFLIFQLYLCPQYCFASLAKNLMFTWGLNKFLWLSLCDRFKIISAAKTWYQNLEKVAQIQGQEDRVSGKPQNSRVSVGFNLIETKAASWVLFGKNLWQSPMFCLPIRPPVIINNKQCLTDKLNI